jgi:antitoxin (DNA-binding transcriptional repressor) of toxin-antitoxin stability system
MSDKMPDMRKVSVRELQQQLRRVLELVQHGETVEITRRHRVIATLSPTHPSPAGTAWPDLAARAREVLGDRVLSPGGLEQIVTDRGPR